MVETRTAKAIRGLVKAVFIACYVAFMWASIHHVATFFNEFEAGNGDTVGSYLLAGAFDLTALVTTIGVMFFRKSMPRYVQVILWVFIIGIACYSFFINWEYAAHFQASELTLQPTGTTTPVYDKQGVLHYVPTMVQNTTLVIINPLLASGFTIFSLIYSVVAEFFGSKPPSLGELQAKQKYLEETAGINESIKQLEQKGKGKSFIQTARDKAMEIKEAVNEVTKKEESTEEAVEESPLKNEQQEGGNIEVTEPVAVRQTTETVEESVPQRDGNERTTDKLRAMNERGDVEESTEIELGSETGNVEETDQETAKQLTDASEESKSIRQRKPRGKQVDTTEEIIPESMPSWLATSGSTIPLQTVVEHTKISIRKLRNCVENKKIVCTRNREIVYKDSLISWLKSEGILKETETVAQTSTTGNVEETDKKPEGNAEENLSMHTEQMTDTSEESIEENEQQEEGNVEETDQETTKQIIGNPEETVKENELALAS